MNLLPLFLIGLGAAALGKARRKARKLVPIWHEENTSWIKQHPIIPRDRKWGPNDAMGHDYMLFMQAAEILQPGDIVQVFIEYGHDRGGVDGDGRERWRQFINHGATAWYIIVHAPGSKAIIEKGSDGVKRRILLKALLIAGSGPKVWKIYDRVNERDIVPPKHSSFASWILESGQDLGPKGRPSIEYPRISWRLDGYLMLPELVTIVRNKKTIWSAVTYNEVDPDCLLWRYQDNRGSCVLRRSEQKKDTSGPLRVYEGY